MYCSRKVNKLLIRPISGRMMVIRDQSSPQSLALSTYSRASLASLVNNMELYYRVTVEC